jgi:hypothetical protein
MIKLRETMGVLFVVVAIVMGICLYYEPAIVDAFTTMVFEDHGDRSCGPGHGGVCPEPYRCINGYCKSDVPPTLPTFTTLPVLPAKSTWEAPRA